jgi:hypothetical protein
MIRPVTCVCVLLAGASGLYLYQSKHRVQLIDRQIEATVRATQAARERTGVLRAEWTLRNDPERLAQLAGRFLQLKTVTPGQFTTLADLGNRLPEIQVPDPKAPDAIPEPAQDAIALAPEAAPAPQTPVQVATAAAQKPEAPKPATAKVAAAAKPERPAEHKPAQLALASLAPAAPRVTTRSVISTAAAFGPAPSPVRLARPISVSYAPPNRVARSAPVVDAPPFAVGSSLGSVRASLPPPVPVPAYNPPNGN